MAGAAAMTVIAGGLLGPDGGRLGGEWRRFVDSHFLYQLYSQNTSAECHSGSKQPFATKGGGLQSDPCGACARLVFHKGRPMNLVGKILVVALLVMSLVFASFTLAVHATHKNWKMMVSNPSPNAQKGEQPGLVQVLADRDGLITRLQTELTEKQKLLDRTVRESEQVRGQLESAVAEHQTVRKQLETEIASKTTSLNEAITAAQTAATVMQKTQDENKTLREYNVKATKDRDDARDEVIKYADELAQATSEWARYQDRNRQLLLQLAQYRLVIQDKGLPLQLDVPRVDGLVTQTHTAEKMVEINLGTDDGLKKGDVMDVIRLGNTEASTQYLGQIRLLTVDKTGAVGSLVPDTIRGTIQKDDHVTTGLK
jgi:hypothetical protein